MNINITIYEGNNTINVADYTPTVTLTVVDNLYQSGGGGGAVDSVNGKTGVVVLGANDIAESATLFWLTDALKSAYNQAVTTANSCASWISSNGTNLLNHLSNTSNPHSVTASQVGLGNVNNTSDANKPISTATQTALDLKANTNSVSAIKISSATVTSQVSAVDFILSGYNYYEIRCMSVVAGTSNVGMWVRVSTDGGVTFKSGASDYMYQRLIKNGFTDATALSSPDSKITFLGGNISNGVTGTYYNATVKVFDPHNSGQHKNITGEFNTFRSDSIYTMGLINGVYSSNTAVNAIRIMLSSGNIASGIFELYGYN